MTATLWLTLLLACSGEAEPTAPSTARELVSSRASRVEVAILESGDASLQLDLPGEVGGDSDANLAAANGGFIERVLVKEGQSVSAGQTLVRVDASLYAAQLEQAEAQLEQAEADLKRLETLGELGARAQLETSRTQQRVAAANVSQARNRLSRAVVKAPFNGVVATVGVEQGEAVAPGTPVVRVVQLDPAVINLSVSDRDVVTLVPGTDVEVIVSSRSEAFRGTVARVSPAADLRTRAFPVEIEVENPQHLLLPGMIARVLVDRKVAEDAMVVPQDWLVTRRDQKGLFIAEDGVAHWREIELGDIIHDKVVVTAGVQTGDRVIVTGHRDLVDGDPLVVTREGTCCAEGRPVFAQAR